MPTIGGSMAARSSAFAAPIRLGSSAWKSFPWSLLLLGLLLFDAPGAAGAKPVDCTANALNNSEKAVCASTLLRSLAAGVDRLYLRVAKNPGVEENQLEWIGIRDRCNGNRACLAGAYRERSAYLATLPLVAESITDADSSRTPLVHPFPRHATSPLVIPAAAPQANAAADDLGATGSLDRAAGPAPSERPPPWNPIWFLSGILCASILLSQMLTNVCGKCPSCHHWFARVEIDQSHLAGDPPQPPAHRLRGLRHAGVTNSLSRRRVTTVRHYNQCRMCLHEWETTSQETV